MTLTTDVAISATVAANLAGKGTAVFSAGLTGTLSTYDTGSALTAAFSTASTEDDDVAIAITDDGGLDGNDVGSLNRIVAATDGDITATISAEAGDLANLTGFSDNDLTITVTNAIGITALGTLQGTSSNDVQITGSITDSLSALYDASNAGAADNQGLRAAALNTAIAADNDVIVIVDEDNAITSDDFAKLNALAGHSEHDSTGNGGYIQATVSGTASAINSGDTALDNLTSKDHITFTVTGTSTWDALQDVDTKTELETIDVEAIEDSYANIINMTNDDDFNHEDANFTVDSDEAINKSKYETLDQRTDGTVTFTKITDEYANLISLSNSVSGVLMARLYL